MSGLISKKTKKRLEGAVDLGKMAAGRNPIVNAALTAKEAVDSAHKIVYGKDPVYVPPRLRRTARRSNPTPRQRVYVRKNPALELLEEDPLKRAYRQTRDPEIRRALRRAMR